MAHPAHSLPASWTVGETLTFFTAPDAPRRHKSYPVTDDDGRVLGMVSRADALRKSQALVELVARRDLLRVRTDMVRHELEREALIRVLPPRRQVEA